MGENLEEYNKFVQSARENNSNVPISNSTTSHAKILYRHMIPEANNYIKIFSGSFDESFYNDPEIISSVKDAIKKGVKVEVITSREAVEKSKSSYPQVTFLGYHDFNIYHFMVIDDKISRLELEHHTKEGDVKATANFNDPNKAKILEKTFSRMSKYLKESNKKA